MLRHKLFHRAKKVPVSEQELKKKMKKKDKKSGEKEEKKKKEDETAESSHAEGRDTEEKKHNTVIDFTFRNHASVTVTCFSSDQLCRMTDRKSVRR